MKSPIEPYMARAMPELQRKTLKQIQVETALTWAGRACAAAHLGLGEATEYAHEAIEHAALSGYDDLLDQIRHALHEHGVDL